MRRGAEMRSAAFAATAAGTPCPGLCTPAKTAPLVRALNGEGFGAPPLCMWMVSARMPNLAIQKNAKKLPKMEENPPSSRTCVVVCAPVGGFRRGYLRPRAADSAPCSAPLARLAAVARCWAEGSPLAGRPPGRCRPPNRPLRPTRTGRARGPAVPGLQDVGAAVGVLGLLEQVDDHRRVPEDCLPLPQPGRRPLVHERPTPTPPRSRKGLRPLARPRPRPSLRPDSLLEPNS